MARRAREAFKVRDDVWDRYTLRVLHQLAARGLVDDETLSPVKIGKEGNVFTAESPAGRIIVKIYRLETCDFNRMYSYLASDPRFYGLQKKRRKVIFAWARREYINLQKAYAAGVPVPEPLAWKDHVLLMRLIGTAGRPASQLKDIIPGEGEVEDWYAQLVTAYRRLYHGAGLVHGDLSPFNILYDAGRLVLIDFSQAVPRSAPAARDAFLRDMRNLAAFFQKHGLAVSPRELGETILAEYHQ